MKNIFSNVIKSYNDTYHSGIKMTQNEANLKKNLEIVKLKKFNLTHLIKN